RVVPRAGYFFCGILWPLPCLPRARELSPVQVRSAKGAMPMGLIRFATTMIVITVARLSAPAAGQCETWQSMGDLLDAGVRATVVYNGQFVAAGTHADGGGVYKNGWIRILNGASWQTLAATPSSFSYDWDSQVLALAVYDGDLLV